MGEVCDGVDGEGDLLDEGDVGDGDVGDGDLLSRINKLLIFVPAITSVSKCLDRSRTTFPFIWNVPDDTPS